MRVSRRGRSRKPVGAIGVPVQPFLESSLKRDATIADEDDWLPNLKPLLPGIVSKELYDNDYDVA